MFLFFCDPFLSHYCYKVRHIVVLSNKVSHRRTKQDDIVDEGGGGVDEGGSGGVDDEGGGGGCLE